MNNYSTLQLLVLLLLLCSLNSFSIATSDQSFLECLTTSKIPKAQLAEIIFTPNHINYTHVLQDYIRNSRFNTSATPKPTLILTPYLDSQVQDIVICAKKSGTQLKIRSGGHDSDGLSYTCDNPFVILDVSYIRTIDIDMRDQTAWVHTGNTVGELYHKIWETSKVHAFPAGVCPTMGIGGHISGGGYGNMVRKYGLASDNVIDAQIVNADGKILNRKGMGEDLFWAIRGGGAASFGVVLAYRIKLVPVPPNVTVSRVGRTLEQNATDIVYRWQSIADRFDNDLFMKVYLKTIPGNKGNLTVTASFVALYLGEADKLMALMNSKFPELGLKKQDCKEMSWIKSALFWAEFPDGTPETALLNRELSESSSFKMKSDYVKAQISRSGWQSIFDKIIASKEVRMMLSPYGGRMSEIPEPETPFPHRAGNTFKILYLAYWNQTWPEKVKSNMDNVRKLYDFMTPFVSKNPREAFLNYRDVDIGISDNGPNAYEEAKVYGVKYFKGNFDRLVQVKTKVDPTNLFRNEQSIPPLHNNLAPTPSYLI